MEEEDKLILTGLFEPNSAPSSTQGNLITGEPDSENPMNFTKALEEFGQDVISQPPPSRVPSNNLISQNQNPEVNGEEQSFLFSKLNHFMEKSFGEASPAMDSNTEETSIGEIDKIDNTGDIVSSSDDEEDTVPLLAILSLEYEKLDPKTKVVESLTKNPFLGDILSTDDVQANFFTEGDPKTILKSLLNVKELDEKWTQTLQNLNTPKISPYNLIQKLGYNAENVKNEILALKQNLPFEGVSRYAEGFNQIIQPSQSPLKNEAMLDNKLPTFSNEKAQIETLSLNQNEKYSQVTTNPKSFENPNSSEWLKNLSPLALNNAKNLKETKAAPQIKDSEQAPILASSFKGLTENYEKNGLKDTTSLKSQTTENVDIFGDKIEEPIQSSVDLGTGTSSKDEDFLSTQSTEKSLEIEKDTKKISENILKQSIKLFKTGGGEAKLTLQTEALGNIDIELTLKDNKIDLQVITSSVDSKDILELESNGLADSLKKEALTLDNFEVKVDQTQNFSQQFGKKDQNSEFLTYDQAKKEREDLSDLQNSENKSNENNLAKANPAKKYASNNQNGNLQIQA